jgi:hypothetical protein
MKVKELLDRIKFCLEKEYLNENDEICTLIHDGKEYSNGILVNITMPKINVSEKFFENCKDVQLVFIDEDTFYKNFKVKL